MKITDKDLNTAIKLMKNGYRRTSRNHFSLSRVDRMDWKNAMAKEHSPWSIAEGLSWVNALGRGASDHYRRVYSDDTITVTPEISSLIDSSGNDPVGFIVMQ